MVDVAGVLLGGVSVCLLVQHCIGGGGFSESEFKSDDPVFDPQREAGVFLNVSSLSGSSGLPV